MTPYDHFVRDLTTWLDESWYLWFAAAGMVLVVVLTVVLAKARTRIRRRVPQYRRHTTSR
ncbi:MAG: hypothetical protein Q8M65_00810 [Rhodoglobus sp.]|nr:hypothetical protein [Rhodoglobus sp.]